MFFRRIVEQYSAATWVVRGYWFELANLAKWSTLWVGGSVLSHDASSQTTCIG